MVSEGFRLGRLLGINVRVHWSWLLIFYLVTWNLATMLGSTHPELGRIVTWAVAAVTALLFFGSVLAHEMAHSLVARRRGIPVRSITLFLFGGVSNIEREPTTPKDEALITIVGPATSLALGFALLWAGSFGLGDASSASLDPIELTSRVGVVAWVLLWLGTINVVLGLFNLVPGFPLDGGRLVRAALWALLGNVRRATKWASRLGQVVGWTMIAVGIAQVFGVSVPVLGSGLVSGLWLAFIGWFLSSAAVQTYQQVVVDDVLQDVPVSRLMRREPPNVRPDCTVSDLVQRHLMGADDRSFPVMDDGRLVGMVTIEDIRKAPAEAWPETLVRDIMTPADALVYVAEDDDAAAGLRLLVQRDVRQLPVLRGDDLVGLLRRRDITLWLQLHAEAAAR